MATAPDIALQDLDHDPAICPFVAAAWARLLQVAPLLLASVETELKAAGLPPAQWYDALAALDRAPGDALGPSDLERGLLITQWSTSRLIDRLEADGLVTRLVNADDRRRQTIQLAPKGRALIGRMWPAYAAAIERHLGQKLSGDDAKALIRILEKLS